MQLHLTQTTIEHGSERLFIGVDIGVEPPIEADGSHHTPQDYRRISLKWLSGTILTGLLGALLVGAAIYAALDEETNFAEAPTPAAVRPSQMAAGTDAPPSRGDRLLQSVDIVAAKESFKAPTTIKVGNKEVVKVKEFTRVATTLTQVNTALADEVPRFDALKLLTDAQNPIDALPDPGPAPDDEDVSFVPRPLTDLDASDPTETLSLEEVQAQIAEHLRNLLAAGDKPALPISPQLLLMRTSRAGIDPSGALSYAPANDIGNPFASIEVRMVPENVTAIPKASDNDRTIEDKLLVIKHNDRFEDLLRANGATPDQAQAIVAAFDTRKGESPVHEGQRLKLTLAEGAAGPRQIARVAIYTDDKLTATVALRDDGGYVLVKPQAVAAQPAKSDTAEESDNPGGLRLYDSLYQSALKQDIPRPMIDNLMRIFANDVDFQRPVSAGDSFEAFYENADQPDGHDDLLYASVTIRGETLKYYRFQAPDDNSVDFYDPNGRSARKFLIRRPVAAGEATSPFGMRVHPILGYARMHTGQDWAAPVGTLIFAAGNGTVIKAGWDSGYGRRIEIQHANGYVTTYSHMSGFARGIAEGVRVRQGQVIGYMGATGLATGPHLHYEVLINGHFVDPMAIKLARTREFDGKMLADFKRERDRIDGVMAKAPMEGGDGAAVAANVGH